MLTISQLKPGDLFRITPFSERVYICVPCQITGLLRGVPSGRLVGDQKVFHFNGNLPVYPVK